MGNQLYRPDALQGVVIKYNLKFTAMQYFFKSSVQETIFGLNGLNVMSRHSKIDP